MFRPSTSQEVALISRYLTQIPVPPASGGKRSLENSSLFAVSGEAEISDIELSALLVDRAFAGSRENGQYSWGFGSPGEWRRLADRAEWGFLAPAGASFSLSQSGPASLVN